MVFARLFFQRKNKDKDDQDIIKDFKKDEIPTSLDKDIFKI